MSTLRTNKQIENCGSTQKIPEFPIFWENLKKNLGGNPILFFRDTQNPGISDFSYVCIFALSALALLSALREWPYYWGAVALKYDLANIVFGRFWRVFS